MYQLIPDITIRVRPSSQADDMIHRTVIKMDDFGPYLSRQHDYFLEHVRKNFATQGAYGGPRWAGYNPIYRRYKKGATGHLELLRWEKGGRERLYPALTSATDRDHVMDVSRKKMVFGARHPHARRILRGGTNQFNERFEGRNPLQMRAIQKGEAARLVFRDMFGV